MANAGELELQVEKSVYEATIAKLEGYMNSLEDCRSRLQEKKNQVNDIWTDDQATEYQESVQVNIENVEKGIKITQKHIDELRRVLELKGAAESIIGTALDAAKEAALKVFI